MDSVTISNVTESIIYPPNISFCWCKVSDYFPNANKKMAKNVFVNVIMLIFATILKICSIQHQYNKYI